MPQEAKESSLGRHVDELFGPASDAFPTSRSSHLAPGEFSTISPHGTDRLNPLSNSLEPQISDNGHRPK